MALTPSDALAPQGELASDLLADMTEQLESLIAEGYGILAGLSLSEVVKDKAVLSWVYYRVYRIAAARVAAMPSSERSGSYSRSMSSNKGELFLRLAREALTEYQELIDTSLEGAATESVDTRVVW